MSYSDLSFSDGYEKPDDGTDSDNNSNLEEIEFALYSQIHFDFNSSLENETVEPQVLPPVGPGGDNPEWSKHNPDLKCPVIEDCESVCDLKSISRTSPVDFKNKVVKKSLSRHQRTSKQKILEDQMFADDEEIDLNYFVSQLSSGSENEVEGNVIPLDLKLNVEETPSCTSPDKTGPWSVIKRDETPVSQPSAQGSSRYYSPKSVKCRNCNERGHLSRDCPRPQKHLICFLCGEMGHNNRTCPNTLCFNCYTAGHSAKGCPKPRRRKFEMCHRCEMRGHIQAECPDLWRQYHLTITEGKLVKGENQPNQRVFCHNCGENSHFGYECEDERINKYTSSAYPFIARYQLHYERKTRQNRHNDLPTINEDEEPLRKRRKLEKNKEAKRKKLERVRVEKRKSGKICDGRKLEEIDAMDRKILKQLGVPTEDLTVKQRKLFELGEQKKAKRTVRKLQERERREERKEENSRKAAEKAARKNSTQNLQQNETNPSKKKKKKKNRQTSSDRRLYTKQYRQKKIGILADDNNVRQVTKDKNSIQIATNRGFNITLPQLKKGKFT